MPARVAPDVRLYTPFIERLPTRPLGNSGIDVSVLALGSWRTYERISREQGLSVMLAAKECGVTFLDDARYNDETGSAPMATGYSEVVFGELFRAAGWRRDQTVVANKLWWEFWPEQSASEELEGSLRRMGFDYVDLVYSWSAPQGPPIAEIVAAVGELIASGKTRAWGTGNWEPAEHAQAAAIAMELGVPPPCAAQLPYNVALREYVESQPVVDALDRSGAGVVASFVLAGGVLSGKYDDPATAGRMRELLDDRRPRAELARRTGPACARCRARYHAGRARDCVCSGERARVECALRRDDARTGNREHRGRGPTRAIDRHAVGSFTRAHRLSQATFTRWSECSAGFRRSDRCRMCPPRRACPCRIPAANVPISRVRQAV